LDLESDRLWLGLGLQLAYPLLSGSFQISQCAMAEVCTLLSTI